MPSAEQLRSRLLKKLSELFQLDQPDLDFGFYRIMHAKAQEVQDFIGSDLLKIVTDAFGDVDEARKAELQAAYEKAIQTAKDFGAPNPEETEPVKKAKAALDAVKDTASAEADVYDHLYRFFERYYDDGDFISRRYYTRETSGKAAPYAVPYNGEEVKLHWANADQYYIKSAEYFSNFTFDLRQAKEVRKAEGELALSEASPLKVHFKIVDATEGEHGNVKASDQNKRFFIIHKDNPAEFNEAGELVCNFEYRPDPEKSGQEGSWRDKRNAEAVETILEHLEKMAAAGGEHEEQVAEYLCLFKLPAPTEKDKQRPVLTKYVNQYTARNTMDYFIHKDLGGFLRRELDFYIKNEVMRLDDIESADAPAVESYLAKIKVLRKIAGKLIDFLAQLEDFQKKLWLKKKFVIETNYCITLDRVPDELYPEIASNEAQIDEWVKLFAIDEIGISREGAKTRSKEGDLFGDDQLVAFSRPLTVEFLKANNKLVLDTRFFDDSFKARLVASIENFDEQCDGLLIHSENFQALSLVENANKQTVKCIYIDPPYNTGQDEFLYKDSYQSSSWLCMLLDRLSLARSFLRKDGAIAVSIDENEVSGLLRLMDDIFGKENRAGIASVKRGSVTGHKAINKGLVNITEYLIIYAMNKSQWNPRRAFKARARNERYNNFIINRNDPPEQWRICSLLDAFADFKGIQKTKLKKLLGKSFEDEIYSFVKNHAESVIQLAYPDESNVSKDAQDAIKASRKNKSQILHFKRDGVPDMYLIGGQRLLFYKDRLVEIDGEIVTAEPLSDIWDDILPNDLHNEGGVSLKKGKKPEKLLNRVYEICCEHKDTVCDFFLGSGTTSATALKRGLKFLVAEQSEYFDSKALRRLKLINKTRKKHETESSFVTKYIRLESYEDTLNNLRLSDEPAKSTLLKNPSLKEDYVLHYLLDVETRGSQSLLNIDAFADPTAYTLEVKKPGTDEYVTRPVDLIETFNYLIGLRVEHYGMPQTFTATFKRVADPELPEDQHTKLVVDGRIRQDEGGPWWFRKVEGWVPKDPANPNNGQREKVLIVWRKLTGDIEQDNLMLDEWFQKNRISTRDFEFDTIYVNGSNNLPNLKLDDENWKVRLIEEEFMKRMWDVEGM